MLRKILIIFAVGVISVLCLSGCKKSSSETGSGQDVVKSMAEYKAEAEKEISEENMETELEKIEKQLKSEIAAGE